MSSSLTTYAREFVAICAHLQKKIPQLMTPEYILVEQRELVTLLDKNQYEETATKLVVWRNLRWIDCEPARFTKSMTVQCRRRRMMALRLSVFQQLNDLV